MMFLLCIVCQCSYLGATGISTASNHPTAFEYGITACTTHSLFAYKGAKNKSEPSARNSHIKSSNAEITRGPTEWEARV